ncbi:hexokinase family protein [Ruminiclostridium papyrosolvens]|uniref:Hexokinase n=1 Tax=Ruminiclostridium papyrosolvens C7 TaxID=1330534 RepID=U4QZB2_9FIRM|nr:hexokinase [Ruminiclostridium papyrosolvens]EPR09478.1 hexokinase [Ruminiclostridium papyrosolvens C7]
MGFKSEIIQNVINDFEVDRESMLRIATLFKETMEKSLKGEKTCLKMIPSYIGKPTGKEQGTFMAIDMGGTNFRCTKYKISNGSFEKVAEIKHKLINKEENYDLTKSDIDEKQLFGFMAECIGKLLEPGESLYLGNTFSFPCRQEGINDAYLIQWTKEITTSGVEGNNINKLLEQALRAKNVNVKPVAILNDTVGTLLVAMYGYQTADIGSIMGTGHNTCYLENNHPLTGKQMIVNTESASYNVGLPVTKYDEIIDKNSQMPGTQLLEKMVSGYYMGSLLKEACLDLYKNKAIFTSEGVDTDAFFSQSINALMVENFILYPSNTKEQYNCTLEDAEVIKKVSEVILKRAVRLVAVSHMGILFHQENRGTSVKNKHVIAIDGTIYEKMPNAPKLMEEAFKDALGDDASNIEIRLVKDGSGLGAAIAAAFAVTQ